MNSLLSHELTRIYFRVTVFGFDRGGNLLRRHIIGCTRVVAASVPAALALSMFAAPAQAVADTSADAVQPAFRNVPAETDADTYTVQPGDTVSAIAGRLGLRTADLLARNGLTWSSIIQPGQVLRLTTVQTSPAPAADAPSAPSSGSYTVVAGDTMSAIARRHGVALGALLAANGLGPSSIIYPGQTVVIPSGGATAAPAAPVSAPDAAAAPASAAGSYVVVSGDTLSGIAERHGVSTAAVLTANGMNRSAIIYPGQTVVIPAAGAVPASPAPVSAASSALDAEQTANAQTIVRVGRSLGVPDQGIAIALAAAMQESSLRNLGSGPDDSIGLFQQRPSTGWGTAAEVSDPERAARAFFGGASDPNGSRTRGLLDIAGWDSMGFGEAAQAVQVSAYPDRYATWEASAYTWLATLG